MEKPPFEDLYREFLGRVYGYVRALVGSAAEAEDVTSQVFVKAFEAYGRFEMRGQTPAAWLFTIARRAAIDHRRRARTGERTLRVLGNELVDPDPAELAEDRIQNRKLLEAVAGLPARQREAIVLRHAGDLSFREVGVLMGCSEDAAKMAYHRGLRTLREMAGELDE